MGDNTMKPGTHRRQFILGSAALLAQAGFARSVFAEAFKPGAVPTVDSLSIRVLTDSSYDTPRPGTSKWVKIKRSPLQSAADYRKVLHNEWGLSLSLESRIGGDTRNLMLDYGYTSQALLNNMEVMGVDGSRVQGMILSHGHYDHLGGMIGFLQKYRDKLPADLTLYVGGEDNFCNRKTASGAPGHFSDWGVLDEHLNEHGTCFNVKDRGLVVITSCGHAGVVNTARQAMEVSGVGKLHAVLGGVHLFPASDEYLQRSVAELKALNPDVVIPMHCSGPGFVTAVREQMPDRLVTSTTSTEFLFGA